MIFIVFLELIIFAKELILENLRLDIFVFFVVARWKLWKVSRTRAGKMLKQRSKTNSQNFCRILCPLPWIEFNPLKIYLAPAESNALHIMNCIGDRLVNHHLSMSMSLSTTISAISSSTESEANGENKQFKFLNVHIRG